MKPVLLAGTLIVNIALICYTVFIVIERRTGRSSRKVLMFLTTGIIFDATATVCMIAGSTNSPFTLHGILGYSALAAMITDSFILWKNKIRRGQNAPLSKKAHLYSLIAWCWWIAAYITGALLVIMRH